jgi:hypothetical protein
MSDVELYDDECWFLCGARGKPAGPRLVSLCDEIHRDQYTLIENTNMCMSVFQYGGGARNIDPEEHVQIDDETLTYNAAQNAVETVFAKVVKNKIALMPLTTGGGPLARHRAKEMEKAIEGVFADNDGEVIEEDVMLDSLVTDHGAGACIVEDGRDRTFIRHIAVEDVWFDKAETRMGRPSCTFYVPKDGIDKFSACEIYANPADDDPKTGRSGFVGTAAERREKILKAAQKPAAWRNKTAGSYRVDIYEAWHPPTMREECEEEYDEEYEEDGETKTRRSKRRHVKHDGRHVVAVHGEDGTLVDEPWDEPEAPILLCVPRRRRRHVFGLSLMRGLLAPQREYERGTAKIQFMHQKMGVSGWVAAKGANVNPREITAGQKGAGFVVEYDHQEGAPPPTPIVTSPVDASTYGYVNGIPRDMLERHGISTLAAASQLPAGLQQASGKALQVFEDFEDVRLLPYHRARERFRVKLAWLIIKSARRIVQRMGGYKVSYRSKRGLEPVDWKDLVDLIDDKESFVLTVFPISALSKNPAAKFAQLTELLNAGAITVEQFKRLFELPDLEAENELDTADTDILDRNMDIMVTTGRYIGPEGFDNLDLLIARAGKYINILRQKDVPDARIKLIRDYIEDAKGLKESIAAAEAKKAAAAAPPPMPMGGSPGGVPPEGPLPGMPPAPPPGPPMPMAA